ncbi:MAG: hypothetical protein EP340_07600 [Alphaproteobacteria bacterium]|nr:MAG: hypothetical protein EP340_07600 [Alphaproteobacteria bacterium]
MTKDLMQYDLLTQDAMRQVVRKALERVEKEGLPGEHHFFITFATDAPDVFVSDALKARYPQEMTIVLQHRFWGLEVGEDSFTVSLTFNKVPEQLVIPYVAIKGFYDPVVQFGVQFHVEGTETDEEAGAEISAFAEKREEDGEGADETSGEKEEATGEVVSLDAFRKK